MHLKEYSLTGYYGCSRGKRGYGFGMAVLKRIEPGKRYFLETIDTAMNTTYPEIPPSLCDDAKEYGLQCRP